MSGQGETGFLLDWTMDWTTGLKIISFPSSHSYQNLLAVHCIIIINLYNKATSLVHRP